MSTTTTVISKTTRTSGIGTYTRTDDPNQRKVVSSSTRLPNIKCLQKNEDIKKNKAEKTYNYLLSEFKGTGRLWEDPDFPANSTSLFISPQSKKYREFEWKRPKEITPNAQLFTNGSSQFDVKQGDLGDCWLLAVIASISINEPLFKNIVPIDQDFDQNYIGAFKFRFWSFGKWKEVIIDDRVPTKDGKLVYMKSSETNEYWSALLEKAYAKLIGNYESLNGGSQSEAMEDFTGGLCETIKLNVKNLQLSLYKDMKKYMSQSTLMGCAVSTGVIEGKLQNGLITGHAYSITDVEEIKQTDGKTESLIRVRNPWGNDKEWKGRWSDNAKDWDSISSQDKKRLCIDFKSDGEFWINYEDFIANFTKLEICHLGPESLDSDFNGRRMWEMSFVEGSWLKNVTAGGCKKLLDSFCLNPQYRVQVIDPDENDDDNTGTIIIGLMQKDVRKRNMGFFTIGYVIYEIMNPKCGVLNKSFFKLNKHIALSTFKNQREVCEKHKLKPGHYVIIPSTFNPNEEADFILRIFTQKPNKTKALDEKNNRIDIANHSDITDSLENNKPLQKELEDLFKKTSGSNKAINSYQLKKVLNEYIGKDLKGFNGFDNEICRSMIALIDTTYTSKLKFPQFLRLVKKLQLWKLAFQEFDEDGNGVFNAFEFRNAINNCGFTIRNSLFQILANRYSDPDKGVITFEDFIMALIRLTNAFETMENQTKNTDKKLICSTDEFMVNILNM